MHLTLAQQQVIKAYILSVPELAAQPMNSDGDLFIANALNVEAVPAYVVWRTSVPASDWRAAVVWVEYKNASAAERDMYALLTGGGAFAINMASPATRAAVDQAFSGAGGAASRTAITDAGKRNASQFEKLLAVGTGTFVAPSTMAVEGPIDPDEVTAIRAA